MLALVILYHAFEDANMERDVVAVDGQEDRVGLVVNIDQFWFQVLGQLFSMSIAFNFAAFDGFLLLEITIEVLVASFLQFLQLLLF
jgi:hypothetical protein